MEGRFGNSAIRVAVAMLATLGAAGSASASTPISLLLPQSAAFSVLGHSCGGIQEQAMATEFDPASGFPVGDVYLQTRCGGSGRGGGYKVTTYSSWVTATWDFTGALVSYSVLAAAPAGLDPALTAFDSSRNELFNQLNAVNVLPASCTVGNTSYCTYRAYLSLAADFVPPPRVTGLSVSAGPASGGTTVTVTGTGLSGALAVSFGGTPAAGFTVISDASLTATAPAAPAGTVDVAITTAGGSNSPSPADEFTFVDPPMITGLSPDIGPVGGGILVTISGASFLTASAVSFGDTPAGFSIDDDSSITAYVPPAEAADTVRVTVVGIGGTSAATPADLFTYSASITTTTTTVTTTSTIAVTTSTLAGTPTCGDGAIDPGEQCDDGAANGLPGDCCSAACTFQPEATPCADDGDLCSADQCDAAGTCTHPMAPSTVCTTPEASSGASLFLRTTDLGNQARFKWGDGPVLPLADFGVPTGGETLQLCVYDEIAPGAYAVALSGSPSQSSGGVWTGGLGGWKFRSTSGAPDGIMTVSLKAGTIPGQGRVQVKSAGSPSFGALPLQAAPAVIAQFKTSLGGCWGATFSTPMVNTATEFKAASD